MTRLILPICIISLLSGCQDANPAEREWKEQLYNCLLYTSDAADE